MTSGILEPISIPEKETEAAAEAARELRALLHDEDTPVVLHTEDHETVVIPAPAVRLFVGILSHLANGEGVVAFPKQAELSTQQAADLLRVSRPFLVDLIKNSELPARKVGTHRRVLLSDLLAYKQRDDSARDAVLTRLVEQTESSGLYK
jgi:excisionase family DNA binding protein